MGTYHSRDLFDAIERNDAKKVRKVVRSTKKKFEHTPNRDGLTPFQHAAKNGSVEILKVLLDCQFDANIPDGECWFAVHHACAKGHMGVLKLITSEDLGQQKADINNHCVVSTCRCRKQTALHVACQNNFYNCVVFILALTPDLKLKDKNNKTAYDIALQNKQQDIVDCMKPFMVTCGGVGS